MTGGGSQSGRVDFERINGAALSRSEAVLRAFLPDGRQEGHEWCATNPTRSDKKRGSFKCNVVTGQWCDFATGDRGGDLISLAAYVERVSQREAAIRLAESLGVHPYA